MNKFIVYYEDGTTFEGNQFNSDWLKIDETKRINKLEYFLNKIGIRMEGFKQYNHLLECVGLGQKGINKILLMGRTDTKTDMIILDIRKNQLYKEERPLYQEYGNQILAGWQEGNLNEPKISMMKVQ